MGHEHSDWLERWCSHLQDAGLSQDDAIGRKLIRHHAGPSRHYHGLSHLEFLFGEIDTHRDQIRDLNRLIFATWFHDAIYISWRKDNEARSANWAVHSLGSLGASEALQSSVGSLIRQTANHAEGGNDNDDNLFLDMDCAILGAPADVYAKYAKGVRSEYWWVPKGRYRAGRKSFLENQIERSPLFLTEAYNARYGAQALVNMREEVAGL